MEVRGKGRRAEQIKIERNKEERDKIVVMGEVKKEKEEEKGNR